MGIAFWISFLCHLVAETHVVPVLAATILNFPLPVTFGIIQISTIEKLDYKNIGVTTGTSFLSDFWCISGVGATILDCLWIMYLIG